MAFTSSCPKCQKQVLVPDGTCPDAVVRCPVCSGEYSLGEILASAPPALIVVHAGSGAAAPAAVATIPPPAAGEAAIFSAHRVEPALHDAEPLLFEGDEAQLELATPDYGHAESFGHAESLGQEPEHVAEAALFESSPAAPQETDHPIEALADPFGEPLAAPLSEDDLAAESAEGGAPWGGAWGEFKDEAAHEEHEEDGAVGLAEPDRDEGLENVDFAAITGKAAPGSARAAGASEAAVMAELGKKPKRKREASMLGRAIGMIISAVLAVVCFYFIAIWVDHKNDRFHLIFKDEKPTPNNAHKTIVQPTPPSNGQTPAANTNPTPANASVPSPAAGNPVPAPTVPTPAGQPGPAPNKPAIADAGKGTEVAMNNPANEIPKPVAPAPAKARTEPSPFGEDTDTKPVVEPPVKAPAKSPAEPEVPAPSKPETSAKPDADAFDTPPVVAPANKKDKTDAKPEVKSSVEPPIGPDVPAPSKPETAAKPDADPFGPAPAVAPVNKKDKTDAKTEVKPPVEPDASAPSKPEPSAKPDADPFGPAPVVAPVNKKDKTDVKPEVSAPLKPELPGMTEKPEPDAKPSKTPDLKPDVTPDIKPDVKPEVKPDVTPGIKPEVKPDVKPEVKPAAGVSPLQAPSFLVADLDAKLKAVENVTVVDAKSYAGWCDLAEVVTYVKDGADSQKQSLRTLTGKIASSPQAASAIAAAAKKLLDGKVTTGGIVLAGTVTGLGTQNGLCGTAIRMAGMDNKPVRIFSAHPLDVKEGQKVIVLGAFVADPAKNLPGYPGKQPVVVWADFALAIP